MKHTGAVFEDEPDQTLGHNDLVEPSDMWVMELSMVMDLSSEVGVVPVRRFEDNLVDHLVLRVEVTIHDEDPPYL